MRTGRGVTIGHARSRGALSVDLGVARGVRGQRRALAPTSTLDLRTCTLVRVGYAAGWIALLPFNGLGVRRAGTGHAPRVSMNARSGWPCLGPAWRARRAWQ